MRVKLTQAARKHRIGAARIAHPRNADHLEEEVTMQIQLGDGTTAEIASIENIDLDEQVVYFEGERLTEAGAEAIARDIAARHGRKGGRPRLAEETSRLGLRLPRELHERLRDAAHQAGVSESELAREAIDDYLAKGA